MRHDPLCSTVLTGVLVASASAHPILITSGTVTTSPEAITLRLPITDHDLEHANIDPDDPASADTFARDLGDRLVMLDESGVRLRLTSADAVAPGEGSPEPWEAVLRYQPPPTFAGAAYAFVTFQQRRPVETVPPDQEARAVPGPPRLIQLTVPGVGSTEIIRLSDAGNPETVPILQAAATFTDPLPPGFDPESLRVPTLRAETSSGSGMTLNVEVPAHLLRTWIELPRADPDVLTADEAASFAAIAANWAEVQVQPTGIARAEPAAVRWLRPSDPHAGPAVPHPKLGFWSARIMIPLRLSAPNADTSRPRWTGFNNSVRVVRFDSSGHQPRIRYLVQRAEGVELPLR